jgi:hypothetical protein
MKLINEKCELWKGIDMDQQTYGVVTFAGP